MSDLLSQPQALELIPAERVEELIASTRQELARLEQAGIAALEAAERAEREARGEGFDLCAQAGVVLQRVLDELRADVNREARTAYDVAERQARARVEEAHAEAEAFRAQARTAASATRALDSLGPSRVEPVEPVAPVAQVEPPRLAPEPPAQPYVQPSPEVPEASGTSGLTATVIHRVVVAPESTGSRAALAAVAPSVSAPPPDPVRAESPPREWAAPSPPGSDATRVIQVVPAESPPAPATPAEPPAVYAEPDDPFWGAELPPPKRPWAGIPPIAVLYVVPVLVVLLVVLLVVR